VRCGTSKQKRPSESGHGVEISVIPKRSQWTEEMSLLGTFETFRDVRSVVAIGGKADIAKR
jgi:hypothetical protein